MLDRQENTSFTFGMENGKRWISGKVDIGKGKTILVDTRTGRGVNEILLKLNNFISYQASKVKFPSYAREDIMQEIRVLALEAIPKYDNSKNTNIITFLQNHIKNRIVNMCKFFSEKRRRATFCNTNISKIRCPSCRKFFMANENAERYTCSGCFFSAQGSSPKWKKYNVPILPVPSSSMKDTSSNEENEKEISILDVISESDSNLGFVMEVAQNLDERINNKLDFFKIYNKLDNTNKKILRMVMEGYTYKDISEKVGISEKAAYARAIKIIKG